ncbi:hypothetical protein ColLi_12933 [Colletotrichum liriopes]|uniref:DUF7730 domain-containing protein n=1 Tax=Colletotrichum liriopes TaxID=708192 RepID=A0AA37GZA4_9PEZI|nr:hypothetical protein ColLi_12933 [Colletotrichum liriopes]
MESWGTSPSRARGKPSCAFILVPPPPYSFLQLAALVGRWRRKRAGCSAADPEKRQQRADRRTTNDRWDLNRARSPLLRLPPEIRNKIYRLLLAARRIHVHHDPKTSSFHCVALRPTANPWTYKRHHVLSRGLTLLVRVCRQLYHETELLPYRECVWSWQTPGLMERYLLTERRMGVAQRRAVREVCVRGIRGFGNLSRRVRGVLGGLEVVWFWEGRDRGKGDGDGLGAGFVRLSRGGGRRLVSGDQIDAGCCLGKTATGWTMRRVIDDTTHE